MSIPCFVVAETSVIAIHFLCCGLVFGIALGTVIGAVILRAAVKWVLKFDLEFGPACTTALAVAVCNWIVSFIIGFGVGFVFHPAGGRSETIAQLIVSLVSLPPSFLIAALLYGRMIRYPTKSLDALPPQPPNEPLPYAVPNIDQQSDQPIGFSKGASVALMVFAIAIGIAIFMVIFIIGVIYATGTRL
jgi:hypothetical protein